MIYASQWKKYKGATDWPHWPFDLVDGRGWVINGLDVFYVDTEKGVCGFHAYDAEGMPIQVYLPGELTHQVQWAVLPVPVRVIKPMDLRFHETHNIKDVV